MITNDYKLKNKKNIKLWGDIQNNRLEYAKKSYHPSFNGLLSRFKKVFKITPISLKQNQTQKAQELRGLALYLLLKYTKDINKIVEEFKVNKRTLNDMKNNPELEKKFETKENLMFDEDMISGEMRNYRLTIAFNEELSESMRNHNISFE